MGIIDSLRAPKLFNIALFDVVGTLIGAYALAEYMNADPYQYMFFAIVAGIVAHKLFGINTQLNYYLGLSDKPLR